ncbi:hypothetical protein B0H66DRAFT_33276 [Apodospora peruviana]|uniref:Uncharacterized protein n=1 Tax=Apodospora peruviana TaxID=516989 RepID=A0AAE0IRC6_9PEZI|nr:hypothetical protein B0H66DRAFT_33276 [Apodospora peruviana]
MNHIQLTQTLTESFNALADEVQSLIDRKTILEHKLRYAHEQYQYLADKYAPGVPEVSETLAKLQLPPDLHSPIATPTSVVPLPRCNQGGSGQHQIALLIREGRIAAQQLAADMGDVSKEDSGSSKETSVSPGDAVTMNTTVSTVLEQDFTVPGKKGLLACPFSAPKMGEIGEQREEDAQRAGDATHDLTGTTVDPTPHHSSDPICAAMLENTSAAPATAASKCPIRYLDKHSPEEIAHYVEQHKHEIPRSHEVCVGRYQKNEEQIRKLDAKYGNLVSMINDLSHLHRPMLPVTAMEEDPEDVDRASNKRVESWAQAVTASDPQGEEEDEAPPVDVEDRESHFDRPLREVRLGESPSRPWGISVPFAAGPAHDELLHERPVSPSPAPVRMHSPLRPPQDPGKTPRKCPFDHTKLTFPSSPFPKPDEISSDRESDHVAAATTERQQQKQQHDPFTTAKNRAPQPQSAPAPTHTAANLPPTFVNTPEMPFLRSNADAKGAPVPAAVATPQIVFNISGPVFIGYPMEQAIQFMQRFQGQ